MNMNPAVPGEERGQLTRSTPTNGWCSVPDPVDLTALFHASGGGFRTSRVMDMHARRPCARPVKQVIRALAGCASTLTLGTRGLPYL